MVEKLDSDAFLSQRNFYDDENFPYGFQRAGDFTIAESDILTSHGYVMVKLHKGDIPPTTPEHRRFLQVVNKSIAAKYFEEQTYLKYLQVLKTKNNFIAALSKLNPKTTSIEESDEMDTEL